MGFDHERLDVYRKTIAFIVQADAIASTLPGGRSYLVDQLRRAATSIALDIAEGAGKYARKDKSRFYLMARGSATECAAILDVCIHLELAEETPCRQAKDSLERIVSMLTRLSRIRL